MNTPKRTNAEAQRTQRNAEEKEFNSISAQLRALCVSALICASAFCFSSFGGTISSYPNTGTLASNDLFIIERGPGVADYNIQAYQLYQAIGLFGLVASNLVDGPVPSGLLTAGTTNGAGHLLIISSGQRWITYDGSLLSNVTASVLASAGTNYGFNTNRAFTNTLGRNLWVQMSNATATAVFNSLSTNVIPATSNPSNFPLSLNMYFTNATGGFFYYAP